ncbi:TetR/AcrR family transcriptional regulator [Nocardia transvalensis]|uniref:TetR/AcrR family transcriptional regulator n=1 Tax=Nocardia transvalensis TaxID=37333 RepID=UPI0003159BCC|nr:TetR/AcrR family transcriptional regulator [Nocardia transvalensis]
MASKDWLIGRDRSAAASHRIYAAAAELIARDGFDKFTIDALAAKIHCSPATIYRHAGGKAAIREAVLGIFSARVVNLVRDSIRDLDGPERVVTAVIVALQRIRSDPLGPMMMNSIMSKHEGEWLVESSAVEGLADEMIGRPLRDPSAAQWLIRVVFMLWRWPVKDPEAECRMIRTFLAPGFADGI